MSTDNTKKSIFRMLWYQEFYIFIIALAIISIFAIMIFFHFPDDEQIAQGLFTGIMAWMGAIVGFYFGQKPVREVLTRMEETNINAIKKKAIADKAVTDAYDASDHIEELIKKNKRLKEKIKELE